MEKMIPYGKLSKKAKERGRQKEKEHLERTEPRDEASRKPQGIQSKKDSEVG